MILTLFIQRRNRNLLEAAGTMLILIYHQTVYILRSTHRNPIIGILITIAQTAIFIAVFTGIYFFMGRRGSPIRGDFMMYLMSGIFLFMTHVRTAAAVSASYSVGGLTKHAPLNALVLVSASALSTLYGQVIAAVVIVGLYHLAVTPVSVYFLPGSLGIFLLAWFSGICVGLVFLALKPWAPSAIPLVMMAYQRINMIASGKFFVVNTLPNFVLPWFSWNPLFHLIDQMRGFVFVNYTPQKTDYHYTIWVCIVLLAIGLLVNFTTRKYESVSWGASQ